MWHKLGPPSLKRLFGAQFICAFYLLAPPCIGWASPFSLFGYPLDCNKYNMLGRALYGCCAAQTGAWRDGGW